MNNKMIYLKISVIYAIISIMFIIGYFTNPFNLFYFGIGVIFFILSNLEDTKYKKKE